MRLFIILVFTKDRWKDVKPVEEAMQFERLP
jgi:hypothetical protein